MTDTPDKPAAPIVTDTSRSSVSLSWSPPLSDGGSKITSYHLEKREAFGFKWSRVTSHSSHELEYTVTSLREGSQYEFRVSAENKAGVGPPSEPCKPVFAKAPYGKFLDLWSVTEYSEWWLVRKFWLRSTDKMWFKAFVIWEEPNNKGGLGSMFL